MQRFIIFASGFLSCAATTGSVSTIWLICHIFGAILMLFVVIKLFWYLIQPDKQIMRALIAAMIHSPKSAKFLAEKIYPKAEAQLIQQNKFGTLGTFSVFVEKVNAIVQMTILQLNDGSLLLKDGGVYPTTPAE